MTKLTQQEIEQERGKFEKWYRTDVSKDAEMRKENGVYNRFWQRDKWEAWIARAELEKELKEKLTDEFINALPYKFISRAELAKGENNER